VSQSKPNLANEPAFAEEPQVSRAYRGLKSGAGLYLDGERLIVRVTGADCVSFMHGMCTADVKGLVPGSIAPALFLTEHAHVIADCFIYALDDRALWLEVERSRWPKIQSHLEKLLVADDVEMEEAGSLAVLDIEGARADDVIRTMCGVSALAPWHHMESGHIRIANLPRYGGPAFSITGEGNLISDIAERIRQVSPEVHELTAEALEIVRIENGLARIGTDTSERTLALEARLERSISFSKGCYIGQETVERATARGSLKRRLCGLRIESGGVPTSGAVITLEGKEAGRLTSITRSPSAGIIGLAILHHSAWSVGTRVKIGDETDGTAASVRELPFGGA
jgi:tRNA-modifying protein YgfZ